MTLKLLVVLASLAAGGVAYAQEPPPPGDGRGPSPEMRAAREAVRAACAADMKTLCDGKMGREMMMCMRENAEKVSTSCKDAISKMPHRPPPPPPAED